MLPLPNDLALFQYSKGIVFGVLIGVALGWLFWRLPATLRTRHTRKLRAIVMDLKRIEAAMVGERGAPNPRELRIHRIPWRLRITEAWEQFLEDTKPRTPHQVAQLAHEKVLAEAL